MAHVLTIGFDARQASALANELESRGHHALTARTELEGMQLARARRPHVAILARRLPERAALEVCRTLKSDPATAQTDVILVAEREDDIDRAVARELGVDEYVVGADASDVVDRVEILIAAPPPRVVARFGCLVIDVRRSRVWLEGAPVELTRRETELLLVLSEGIERVHSRQELKQRIWGNDECDATRLVDQYVKRLRRKLGLAGRYIETVRGVGYRFAWRRGEEG